MSYGYITRRGGGGGSLPENYREEILIDNRQVNHVIFHGNFTLIPQFSYYNAQYLNSVVLSDNILEIGMSAFNNAVNLVSINFPKKLREISATAFYYTKINNILFPTSLKILGSSCFANCNSLTTVTFTANPTNIHNTVFQNCPNLTTIRVPWVENAVPGAPWGATNATIIYNYSGGA